MNIFEIGFLNDEDIFTYYAPFVVQFQPGYHETASYWTDIFLAPDETETLSRFIAGVLTGISDIYTETSSLANCISIEQSFFWDNDNQIGYIHLEHSIYYDTEELKFETYQGFTKDKLLYIDGQEYLPFLKSISNVKQQQDIINYKKLSFANGTAVLENVDGELDYFLDVKIHGNNAFNSYIDDEDITEEAPGIFTATRTNIVRMQAFYIENYNVSVKSVNFSLQDIRKYQDADICTDLFTAEEYPDINEDLINEPIPYIIGEIREGKAIAIDNDNNSDVQYRIGYEMTDIGTVQVNINDIWTTVTPTSSTVAKGEFTLDSSDCRDGDGALYENRILNCIGKVVNYASDGIKILNEKYLGINFNSTFYDTAEWTIEEKALSKIGIVFTKKIKLYDAIAEIQDGLNIGFRYEINANRKRTIRIDDESRVSIGYISNMIINNLEDLGVKSQPENIYAIIDILYSKSFLNDKKLLSQNIDYKDYVGANYKKQNTLTRETLLTNEADAAERGLVDALQFKDPPKTVDLNLNIENRQDRDLLLNLRIFDILYCGLTPAENTVPETGEIDGREFLGFQYIKIISINPDPDLLMQKVTAKILFGYSQRKEFLHFNFTRTSGQSHIDFTRTSGQEHFDFTLEEN